MGQEGHDEVALGICQGLSAPDALLGTALLVPFDGALTITRSIYLFRLSRRCNLRLEEAEAGSRVARASSETLVNSLADSAAALMVISAKQ